jgi:ribosomal protein S18 acetylase RimI-like enzyme
MAVRVASREDLEGITETLWQAFMGDPLWRWALEDEQALRTLWGFYAASALRYPGIRVMDDFAAVAVWIPPGGTELTDAEEDELEPLLTRLIGDRAPEVVELVERFEACHPHEEEHYHLTLLGTHPRFRGRGLGMTLLRESLAEIDAEGAAAYLESSNPANDERYRRVGFEPHAQFTTPDGAHTVTTMWRAARS